MTAELRTTLAAGDQAAVLAKLFDLEYLEARCRASIAELVADLAYVLREAPRRILPDASFVHPSGARLDRGAVAILEMVLSVHRERLGHRPERVFSYLHDELYWRDAPARAAHHAAPLARSEAELWRWAEHARAIFEARPGPGWLRRRRPPRIADAAVPSWRQAGEVRDLSGDGASAFVEARGDLYLIDVRTGRVRTKFGGADRGRFSPDGAHLVTCAGTNVTLWAAGARTGLHVFPHAGSIERIMFSRDGRIVFTMATKQLRAWRVADGSCVTHATADAIDEVLPCGADAVVFYERGVGWQRWNGTDAPARVSADPGAHYVVAVSRAGDRLVQHRSEPLVVEGFEHGTRLFQVTTTYLQALAFHPSGDYFADTEGNLRDATTGTVIRQLGEKTPYPSFDPSGRFMLTREDYAARLWDVATGAVVARVEIRRFGSLRAHWSADGSVLALAEKGNTVMVDLAALAPTPRWRDDSHPVGYYAKARFSPSGATLVVAHEDGIGFWDTARGVIRTFAEAKYLGTFAADCCVLGRADDTLIAYAIEDGVELWRTELPRGESEHSYSADGNAVVLFEQMTPRMVIAFAIEDGARRYELAGERVVLHEREVLLTQTSANDCASLRATETGAVTLQLPTRAGTFAISSDRRWLAASNDGIEVWDLTTRSVRHRIATNASSVWFRDATSLVTYRSVTQQSGNQEWNEEAIYDMTTGKCVSDRGWWDQDAEPAAPRELAPGVVLAETQLHVEGGVVDLPVDPIVCRTAEGEVLVASVYGKRLELFAWKPGR